MEKINMMKWVDDALAAEKKQGFLVLSFPAIQKMGISVKELVQSSDLQAQAMKIVADLTPEAAASVSMMDLSLEDIFIKLTEEKKKVPQPQNKQPKKQRPEESAAPAEETAEGFAPIDVKLGGDADFEEKEGDN